MSLNKCRSHPANCNGCEYVLYKTPIPNCCDLVKYTNWLKQHPSIFLKLKKIAYCKNYIDSHIFNILEKYCEYL